jgi:hypothetical protein
MQTINLPFTDNNYDQELYHRLNGRIFHRTTFESYQSILNDGYIYANIDGKRYYNNSGRRLCYGNCHGFVCLFDLRSTEYGNIDDPVRSFIFHPSGKSHHHITSKEMVYLILSPACYESIISSKTVNILDDPSPYGFHIPKFECWYPEKISIDHVEVALCVQVSL